MGLLSSAVGWSQSLIWLGTLGGASEAYAISADGRVVVGASSNRAFRVQPACHHKALGFAQSARERGVGGVGCPVGAWDGGACARDDGAVKGDAVGLVGRGGVEGVLAQVLESGVGVKVALAVSVVAVGDVFRVGALGACALGDGCACGGAACGVEGCGGDEVLEMVYWVCVVVLPYLRVFQLCHSMRDTRWVFCCSRGRGAGMLKMADFSAEAKLQHSRGFGARLPSPTLRERGWG
jgi:hypothetical protein